MTAGAGSVADEPCRAKSGTTEGDPEAVDGDPTGEDGDAAEDGTVVEAAAAGEATTGDGDGPADETVPRIEMSLYQLSVAVSGRSEDDLAAVEGTARRLMDYLVDRSETLEERPADRGRG